MIFNTNLFATATKVRREGPPMFPYTYTVCLVFLFWKALQLPKLLVLWVSDVIFVVLILVHINSFVLIHTHELIFCRLSSVNAVFKMAGFFKTAIRMTSAVHLCESLALRYAWRVPSSWTTDPAEGCYTLQCVFWKVCYLIAPFSSCTKWPTEGSYTRTLLATEMPYSWV